MSARAPVGASNRSDLFGRRSDETKNPEPAPDNLEAMSDDPLQLEHMLGYSGEFRGIVQMLRRDENIYVKSLGPLLAVENLSDPHQQRILRGHDASVSAMAMSPSGRYMATGQVGTKSYKGSAAPVFIWDTVTWTHRQVLRGLTTRVNCVDFSTDEHFVCGCGEDALLYIWEMSSGEVILGQRLSGPASVMRWSGHYQEGRRVRHELILGVASSLSLCSLSYDATRVQWALKITPFSLPPGHGAVVRYFTTLELLSDEVSVLVGTTAGDMMVYRRDTAVYRSCIPVTGNGCHSLVALPDGDVLCGGGDGWLKRLSGQNMEWSVVNQVSLDGSITSLSLSPNCLEVIATCTSGSTYRLAVDSLAEMLCSASHTSSVSCIGFGSSVGYFATGTLSGELRVWDIGDYGCQAVTRLAKAGAVRGLFVLSGEREREREK